MIIPITMATTASTERGGAFTTVNDMNFTENLTEENSETVEEFVSHNPGALHSLGLNLAVA